jgi:hypothetical protein
MISHFLWFDAIYAWGQTDLLQDLQSKLNTANIYMNVIYILLRPGLILAGMALDNNMIYGTFFRLDAPLWVIWNIIKNFANFTLWFMVLVEVIKMVFNFEDDATSKITEVIKKCIIAGIGIQASRFLLAATIDLSTVATYGIWGLPLSILWTSQDATIKCLADKKILGVASTMDFTNSTQNGVPNQGFKYYYYIDAQGGRKNYSPCKLKDNYVVGREYGWPETISSSSQSTGTIITEPGYCILQGSKVVRFNGEIAYNTEYQSVNPDMNESQYSVSLQNAIAGIGSIGGTYTFTGLAQQQKIFDINSKEALDVSDGWGIAPLYAIPQNPARSTFNETGVLTMKNLLDSSKGMMWPLITLYSSILNFSQFNIQTSNGDDRALVIEAVIKTLLALALLLPMLLTALVMLVRVWILWVVIALSPFFVLKRSFKDSIGEGLSDIPILKYWIGDLIKVIFAPVVIVFAVSLSIIFMSLLTAWFSNRGDKTECAPNTKEMYRTTFDVDEYIYVTWQTLKYSNLFEISTTNVLGNSTGGDARDYIGWIIINLFGIGVVWMILMAALSFSKDLWDAIGVDSWKKWFTNTIWSIPFIPVPTSAGLGFVWAKTFGDVSSRALSNAANKVSLEWSTKQAFEDLALGDKDNKAATPPATGAGSTLTASHITQIDNAIKNWTSISQIRDDIIKSDATLTASVDNHIAESFAKLAATKDPNLKDKKTIQTTIDNFIQAKDKMTADQLKSIYKADSNLKYMLLPKDITATKKEIIKVGDNYLWVTLWSDTNITTEDVAKDSQEVKDGKYIDLSTDDKWRKQIDEFITDLEERSKQDLTNKTKRDAIISFYNKP